jgi:glycosyltransferase involved in cell wall biosynthesis
MKLAIQIPCFNEEATLPIVLDSIPKKIAGIDEIVIIIMDDASTDKTIEVAKAHGVKHIVRHAGHVGLGRQFHDGIELALELGADIVVNTDGDNQYPQERIGDLIQPVVEGKADIVIGDRQTQTVEYFSPFKKALQRFGSYTINKAAGTNLPDAASGFRAYSKEALMQLNTITRFSYCMETIIQAGNKKLAITSIPITVNAPTRESRLFTSIRSYVFKSGSAIVRGFIMYKPYLIFGWMSIVLLILGIIPILRYMYFALVEHSTRGHLQSLIIGAVILIAAFLCLVLNIIADLIRINRTLIELNLEHTKRMRFKQLN